MILLLAGATVMAIGSLDRPVQTTNVFKRLWIGGTVAADPIEYQVRANAIGPTAPLQCGLAAAWAAPSTSASAAN
jgi:hypothetical protein